MSCTSGLNMATPSFCSLLADLRRLDAGWLYTIGRRELALLNTDPVPAVDRVGHALLEVQGRCHTAEGLVVERVETLLDVRRRDCLVAFGTTVLHRRGEQRTREVHLRGLLVVVG